MGGWLFALNQCSDRKEIEVEAMFSDELVPQEARVAAIEKMLRQLVTVRRARPQGLVGSSDAFMVFPWRCGIPARIGSGNLKISGALDFIEEASNLMIRFKKASRIHE